MKINLFRVNNSTEFGTGFGELFFMYAQQYIEELRQYTEFIETPFIDEFANTWIRTKGKNAYLIKCGKLFQTKIVGFVLIEEVEKGVCGIEKDSTYIAEFYIKPEFRQRRFGTAAVSEILKLYSTPLFLTILKSNTPAQKFWEKQINFHKLEMEERDDIFFPHKEELDVICIKRN